MVQKESVMNLAETLLIEGLPENYN